MNIQATGNFIKTKRKEIGLSQQQLANMLYVEPQTISKWERGLGMPDYDNLEKLAEILKCNIAEILQPPTDTTMQAPPTNNNDSNKTNLPMVIEILENKSSQQKEKFKFSDFFNKKKIKDRISKVFGYEYENIYNRKFLFKNVFKKRTHHQYEQTLTQGMFKDNINHSSIGVEAPWLYMRVFFFLLTCTLLGIVTSYAINLPIYSIIFGTLFSVIPLLVFLYESNFSRDISIFQVSKIFIIGGLLSILLALIFYNLFALNEFASTVFLAPIIEEISKFIIAIFFVNKIKPKNILSGLLIGFAVGGGFTVFESMKYGLDYFLIGLDESLSFNYAIDESIMTVIIRTIYDFFMGHHYWTAIVTGIYVLFKKDANFKAKDLFNVKVLLALLCPMILHMIWNGNIYIDNVFINILLKILVCVLSTGILITLINIGIAQVKVLNIYNTAHEDDENHTPPQDDIKTVDVDIIS